MQADNPQKPDTFSQKVGEKEKRLLKAQRQKNRSAWYGFGMFGMVGWSVAVPALAGAALGIWLDKNYPAGFSWTLTFMFAGLVCGCIIAWYWVLKEDNEMHKNNNTHD